MILVQPVEGYAVHPDMPHRATPGAAGIDLRLAGSETVTIWPMERRLLPTGYRWDVGLDRVGLICPRSGLALKRGITVLNAPGVLDSDYRGEVKVLLINLGDQPQSLEPGERIAQIVITRCCMQQPRLGDLEMTDRGDGGFGSTGTL